MRKFLFIFVIVFYIISGDLFSQSRVIDSLNMALKNAKHDTTRCLILNAMFSADGDPQNKLKYMQKRLQIADANANKPGISPELKWFFRSQGAGAINGIGIIYYEQGNSSEALLCYTKSLKIREEIGDKLGMAKSLNNLGNIYRDKSLFLKAIEYYTKSLIIREEIGDKKGTSESLNNIGILYNYQNNIAKALQCYNKSLKIREELGDKKGISISLINLALIYNEQGDIPKALESYQKSLKIAEEIGDKKGISTCLNNIALIYNAQGDFREALVYYNKSLKIDEEIGNKKGISTCLNNIGKIYNINGDPAVTSSRENALRAGILKALEYFNKSLKIKEEIGDKKGISNCLINIGTVYKNTGDPLVTSSKESALRAGMPKAIEYLNKSLKITEEIGDKSGITIASLNIGEIYLSRGNVPEALKYFNTGMKLSREISFPKHIQQAASCLYILYKATGKHQLALENYELYIQMRDSIHNESTRKASIKSQLKYEYEKQTAADSVAHAKESEIKNVQLQKQTAEIKAKKNQQVALFGGLGLVIIFAGFMFNRFKITQKQKTIIEHQKEIVEKQKKIVEEKQKEILDSIAYARRIQMALIPTDKYIERILMKLQNHEGN